MMQYLTPKTSIKGINEAALRSSSAQAVAEIKLIFTAIWHEYAACSYRTVEHFHKSFLRAYI